MLPKPLQSVLLLCLFLTSCASVSIRKESWADPKATNPSYLIKVESPNSSKEVRTSHPTPLEDLLATELVNSLQPHRPAFWTRDSLQKITQPNSKIPHHILHVYITEQQPGNRVLRSLIGWGTGRTALKTQVSIHSPAKAKVEKTSQLTTQGGSGAMPGALFTDPFLFLPAAAILASTTGLTYDVKRTAKTIAQAILQNHIENGPVASPKRTSDPWYAKVLPPLRQKNLHHEH